MRICSGGAGDGVVGGGVQRERSELPEQHVWWGRSGWRSLQLGDFARVEQAEVAAVGMGGGGASGWLLGSDWDAVALVARCWGQWDSNKSEWYSLAIELP